MMKRIAVAFLFVSCMAAVAACSKAGAAKSRGVKGPKPPTQVMAMATVKSPNAALGGVKAYLDGVSPGMGRGVPAGLLTNGLGELVDAPGLDGIDFDQPLAVMVVDPQKHRHPFVILATIKDEKALRASAPDLEIKVKDGRALIGEKEAVGVVTDYGWKLAKEKAPEHATVTLYLGSVLDAYRAQIKLARAAMVDEMEDRPGTAAMGKMLESELDMALALAEETDQITLTLDPSADTAVGDLALVPRSGTPFAAFCDAQKPSDYPMVKQLAEGASHILIAGRLDFSSVRKPLLALLVPMMKSVAADGMDEKTLGKKLGALMDEFGGEMAATGTFVKGAIVPQMEMSEIFAVKDGPKMMEMTKDVFGSGTRSIEMMGVKMKMAIDFSRPAEDGASFGELTAQVDLDALPPEQARLMREMNPDGVHSVGVGVGKTLSISFGPNAVEHARAQIAAITKGTKVYAPSKAVEQALADSRARHESMVAFFDFVSVIASQEGGDEAVAPSESGVTIGFGFADGSAHMRVSVPAAHVKEIIGHMSERRLRDGF